MTSIAGQGALPRRDSAFHARSATDRSVELAATPSRHIGIKRILACIDGTDKDRTVLDYALQVALRFISHIDVLHVRFDVHGSVGTAYERQVDHLLGTSVERVVAEAATHARRHFDEWQARCKLPLRDTATAIQEPSTRWREIVGYEDEVVARLGRLSDLIVISRPSERSSSFAVMALETALFDTCRPVLMVPDGRLQASSIARSSRGTGVSRQRGRSASPCHFLSNAGVASAFLLLPKASIVPSRTSCCST